MNTLKKALSLLLLSVLLFACTKSTVKKYACSDPALTGNICLPNIFTPNGDGVNDVLYVRQSPGFPQIDSLLFYIKDGTGSIMFHSDDPAIGWDGKYNGKIKNGVFTAEITAFLTNDTKVEFSGTVTCLKDSPADFEVNNCEDCRFDSQFDGQGGFDVTLPTLENGPTCN